MTVDANNIVHLAMGDKVNQWTVTKKLGEGTFGAVYKVKCDENPEEFALKTEHITQKFLLLELKVMQTLVDQKSQYCCLIQDKGRTEVFNYIVMKLVGQSLQDAKKTGPNMHLNPGCALSVSIQCLEGLRELHATGFIHRDIKPGNYAVGLAEKNDLRRIYLLDFGMCKIYRNTPVAMEKLKGKFRGTPRYAPMASHKNIEHARKDDLESWFYMLVDFHNAALPWKVVSDLNQVGELKEKCRSGPLLEQMMTGVPMECAKVLSHIDNLGNFEAPDYKFITDTLRKCIDDGKFKEFPYDWEPQTEPQTDEMSKPGKPKKGGVSVMGAPPGEKSKSKGTKKKTPGQKSIFVSLMKGPGSKKKK